MMLCVLLLPGVALAGHGGGHGGGGGALSHVSSGLGGASRGGGGGGSSSSGSHASSSTTVIVDTGPSEPEAPSEGEALPEEAGPAGPAHVVGYFGMQKVHDSDHSLTIELALEDKWARIGAQLTEFSESQGDGMPALTLSMPAFTIGVRIDRGYAGMRAYLEGGVVGAKTNNDPTMDTSWVGGLGGLRVELPIAARTQLVLTAQAMMFSDHVMASATSAGLQVGPLQLSMRVVDFNVGPPLYGPEVGLRF